MITSLLDTTLPYPSGSPHSILPFLECHLKHLTPIYISALKSDPTLLDQHLALNDLLSHIHQNTPLTHNLILPLLTHFSIKDFTTSDYLYQELLSQYIQTQLPKAPSIIKNYLFNQYLATGEVFYIGEIL